MEEFYHGGFRADYSGARLSVLPWASAHGQTGNLKRAPRDCRRASTSQTSGAAIPKASIPEAKEPIYPERLQVLDKEGRRTVVFLFPRAPVSLTLEDKEVIFANAVGSPDFKVRFPLKEMMYHGKLDLCAGRRL